VSRGSLTFWVDEAAVKAWYCHEHHGYRGRGFSYSDMAIETALMIKDIFSLSLRAVEGFLNSLFMLMSVPLKSPITLLSVNAQAWQRKTPHMAKVALSIDASTH